MADAGRMRRERDAVRPVRARVARPALRPGGARAVPHASARPAAAAGAAPGARAPRRGALPRLGCRAGPACLERSRGDAGPLGLAPRALPEGDALDPPGGDHPPAYRGTHAARRRSRSRSRPRPGRAPCARRCRRSRARPARARVRRSRPRARRGRRRNGHRPAARPVGALHDVQVAVLVEGPHGLGCVRAERRRSAQQGLVPGACGVEGADGQAGEQVERHPRSLRRSRRAAGGGAWRVALARSSDAGAGRGGAGRAKSRGIERDRLQPDVLPAWRAERRAPANSGRRRDVVRPAPPGVSPITAAAGPAPLPAAPGER